MTPYYLVFTDEAQAISVLYTTTSSAEMVNEDGSLVIASSETTTPNYANISVLGTVYQPAPEPMPEDYVPVPYPAPNYGVNVLVLDNEDATPLQPYSVNPTLPQRVWAI